MVDDLKALEQSGNEVSVWKLRLYLAENRMLAAEIGQLKGEAECWRLAKAVYEELLKLDRLVQEKESEV
jgi:hypothetical protein